MTTPEFKPFGEAVAKRFAAMSQQELYMAGSNTDELWDTYLAAFPEGTNPIYKTRTEYDCSCCRNFIKNVGNAVTLTNGKVGTIWDVPNLPYPFDVVAAKMNVYVRSQPLTRLFRRSEQTYGAAATRQTTTLGETIIWNHFYGKVEAKHFSKDPGPVLGAFDTTVQVFKRGLEELKADAFETVLDLIQQKNLYRGEEHLDAITAFRAHVRAYNKLSTEQERSIYVFEQHADRSSRFRNTVIGSLLTDLSDGMDVEQAVRSFESKVAPQNYKRTTALITPKMVDAAMNTINELGLEPALARRYARMEDITVNNVLWVDTKSKSSMRSSTHDMLMGVATAKVKAPKPSATREMSIEDFMRDVAPTAQSINMMVHNQHSSNFVSLTTAEHANVEPLFRWPNNFGWSYDGNITDSIKEKVKRAGGNVEGKLRFSLEWFNYDDLDIHCRTPDGEHIYFGHKIGRGGHLDVDMNAGGGHSRTPVENIAFTVVKDGNYTVSVNQYNRRETIDVGFTVEIADTRGSRFLSYKRGTQSHDTVDVATVVVKGGVIADVIIKNKDISAEGVSQDKWGVKTETWTPVQTIMYSPNHWDDNKIGNKHWFFMLQGCHNPESTRGIYNEFLSTKLEQHRKVFEVLGNKSKCPESPNQLSGVGFSSTRGDTALIQAVVNNVQTQYTVSF